MQPVLLNLIDGLQLLGHNFLGKLCIRQALRVILSVTQSPLNKALQCIALCGVGKLLRNQKPSEGGDRIRGFARRVGDGNAEVFRHVLGRSSSRGAYCPQAGLHEYSVGVLYLSVRYFVRLGVDELDIRDGVRGVLDGAGNAFAPLAAETDRPIDRSAFAHLVLPLRADFREIVGPTIGGAASVRAVDNDDVLGGKLNAFVRLSNQRIVPLRYLAQENPSKSRRRKFQGSVYSGNIVRWDDGA